MGLGVGLGLAELGAIWSEGCRLAGCCRVAGGAGLVRVRVRVRVRGRVRVRVRVRGRGGGSRWRRPFLPHAIE